MKCALVVLALAGCEKQGAHIHARPAKIGDRIDYHFRHDGHAGADHGEHGETSLILEVLSVAKGQPERMQITVDRDDEVRDGVPNPSLTGTYELTEAGELSRPSGKPLTDYEREHFRTWHIAPDLSVLRHHEFRAGERYRPTADEAHALFLPEVKAPWEFDVKRADDDAVVLAGDFEFPDSSPDHEKRGSVTITLGALARTYVVDVTSRRDGKDDGAAHETFSFRPQR